jgi:hypothetical protein
MAGRNDVVGGAFTARIGALTGQTIEILCQTTGFGSAERWGKKGRTANSARGR